MKKIGFFGGTFDPIHFGHLNLAIQMKERFKLDLILFSPTCCNPFKIQNPPIASFECRKKMIKKAIDGIVFFDVTDIEGKFEKKSFTIDALKELKKIYDNCKLFLLISDEMLKDFSKWKNSNEISNIANILVGLRDKTLPDKSIKGKIPQENFIKTPIFEISSTEIRARLNKKLYCGHLVPYKTLNYIEDNKLYQP
jgi:nicotinate-nucleotide adenylyltransferase